MGISNDALESRMIPVRLYRTRKANKANVSPNRSDMGFNFPRLQGLMWGYNNWEQVRKEYNTKNKVEQEIVGRNYNLFKPLLSVCKVAFPDKYENFLEYVLGLNNELIEDISDNTLEVKFIKVIKALIEENPEQSKNDSGLY